MAAISVRVQARNRLFVELREEDVGDRVMHGLGSRLQEIGETNVEAAFAKTNGGVEGGETAETDIECGDGSAGAEFAVLVFEDGFYRGVLRA